MSTQKIDLSGVSMFDVHPDDPGWTDVSGFVAGLPKASMTVSGFFHDELIAPPPIRRVHVKLDRRPGILLAVEPGDDPWTFTLPPAEALRYARYFSPKVQARLRRMHTAYPRRWRKR